MSGLTVDYLYLNYYAGEVKEVAEMIEGVI